jgi:hypothetical protein
MLAYIFWHRPYAEGDTKTYRNSIARFQESLRRNPSPGFIDAWSWSVEAVPWLDHQPGYEHWCLLEGSWAMDPLNAYAITGETQPKHDVVAGQMAAGAGGLYARVWGEPCSASRSTVARLTRPRGIDWRSALDAIRASFANGTCWKRQMVLGPATEFAAEVPGEMRIAVPDGWQARYVTRNRVMTQDA